MGLESGKLGETGYAAVGGGLLVPGLEQRGPVLGRLSRGHIYALASLVVHWPVVSGVPGWSGSGPGSLCVVAGVYLSLVVLAWDVCVS